MSTNQRIRRQNRRSILFLGILFVIIAGAFYLFSGLNRRWSLLHAEFVSANNQMRKAVYLEISSTESERRKGLMFRSGLKPDEGMLFVFPDEAPRGFWMKDVSFPLAMISLDRNFKILEIHNNVPPFDEALVNMEKPAQYVVEVNPSFLRDAQISVGDSLQSKGPIPRGVPNLQ
jgi:uncharacterized membrane protein (UPF0127 family)